MDVRAAGVFLETGAQVGMESCGAVGVARKEVILGGGNKDNPDWDSVLQGIWTFT